MTQALQNELTPEQVELVAKLKADVAAIVEKDASLKLHCNEHCYVRFLRARSWNLQKASKMLHATLAWRMDFKPHLITWDEVKEESLTGKQMIYPSLDKQGRPVVLLRPRLENTKPSDRQIKYLIYHLEIASRMADESGVGKMTWLLDFQGYSLSNAPPLRTSIHCNSILQNHYPERLGMAVCYHAPTLFSMTWKAVRPFIDPVTQQKIHFVDKGAKEKQQMEERFHMETMESAIGGGLPGFAFKVEEYEQRMLELDAKASAALSAMEQSMATCLTGSSDDLKVAVDTTTSAMQKVAV